MKTNCKAYRVSDQMLCGKCGLQWDVNDPDPPECGQGQPIVTSGVAGWHSLQKDLTKHDREIKRIKDMLD